MSFNVYFDCPTICRLAQHQWFESSGIKALTSVPFRSHVSTSCHNQNSHQSNTLDYIHSLDQ
jgi:hypothetical protein